MSATVQGRCPACGASSLFLGSGGYVTCSIDRCPDPGMASDILADGERYHIVVLGEETFAVQHPLRERTRGVLFDCGLHRHIAGMDGPPRKPGKYRVVEGQSLADGSPRWIWSAIPEPTAEASA